MIFFLLFLMIRILLGVSKNEKVGKRLNVVIIENRKR